MSRQAIELARAAVGAIAIDEFAAMDRPIRIYHISLHEYGLTGQSV
jgi:hypothetical protein